MWGISRGYVLIQDGGDRSLKDFWVHFGTLEWTQVFTGICGIRFIVIQINTSIYIGHGLKKANALILRRRWLFVLLLREDNLSKCCWYNLKNVMTKMVLVKTNCGDYNPLVLVKNLPFLENISRRQDSNLASRVRLQWHFFLRVQITENPSGCLVSPS